MREYKFRGKRLDNGEWIVGYLFQTWERAFILWGTTNGIPNMVEVDPFTIGQLTGLKDKNGKEIYEGDIVRMHFFFENHHPVTYGAFEDEEVIVCELSINPLGVYFESEDMTGYLCDYLQEPSEELEIIGNIHDNPELLKGGAE